MDIMKQFYNVKDQKEDKIARCFREETDAKFDRLTTEFDQISDVQNTEKNFVNQLVIAPHDAKKWGQYAQFCLRNDMQLKAEQCLQKQIVLQGGELSVSN